jgi:ADP-ribose pyrophosphatase YjhB (NUDIX family)
MPNPLTKLILQPYWRLTRSQTLGVQAVIVRGGNEILLVRHSYVRGWHLPGGGVERNEALPVALARELFEETGIEIRGEPTLHSIFSNFERSKGDHIAVYVVDDWRQAQEPKSRLEIIDRRFFPLPCLPQNLIAGARRRLAEVFYNVPISQEW